MIKRLSNVKTSLKETSKKPTRSELLEREERQFIGEYKTMFVRKFQAGLIDKDRLAAELVNLGFDESVDDVVRSYEEMDKEIAKLKKSNKS